VAREYGVRHIADVERNELGTPLVSSIFKVADEAASYATMCYVNADIMFLNDLLKTLKSIEGRMQNFLVIGQRWDVEISERMKFGDGWEQELRTNVRKNGRLHPPAGSDYFIYKRGALRHMPAFALGRAGWDNWMIYTGRAKGIPVVDVTGAATIVHQDHDYAHLPDGQPHYQLPESDENVRLSGGQEMVFTLLDADWVFASGDLQRKPLRERWSRRGFESAIISRFGPGKISRLGRMLFHPKDTFRYYMNAVRRRFMSRSREKTPLDKGRE